MIVIWSMCGDKTEGRSIHWEMVIYSDLQWSAVIKVLRMQRGKLCNEEITNVLSASTKVMPFIKKKIKSRIRETLNLSTDAENGTNIFLGKKINNDNPEWLLVFKALQVCP